MPRKLKPPTFVNADGVLSSQINVSWRSNNPDDVSFEVQRATGSTTGSYSTVAIVPRTTLIFADSGLSPNTQYAYRIRSRIGTLVSPYSNPVLTKTLAETDTTPEPPPSLAAPSDLVVSYKQPPNGLGNGAYLQWTNPVYESNVHLLVERSWDGVNFHIIGTAAQGGAPLFGPTVNTFHDYGTWNGQWYYSPAYYRVRAYNGTLWSDYSNVAQHVNNALPAYPAPTTISPAAYTPNTDAPTTAVVACFSGKVVCLDVTTSAAPAVLGLLTDDLLAGAIHAIIVGDFAYVSSYIAGAFVKVDISDPSAPVVDDSIVDLRLQGAGRFKIDGDFAYILCQTSDTSNGALVVVKLSTMAIHAQVHNEPFTQTGFDCSKFDNYVLAQPNGWHQGQSVYDVTDPAAPVLHGWLLENFVGGGPNVSVVRGNYAYVCQDNLNLAILDIRRPKRPDYIGFLPIVNANAMDVQSNKAYCCGETQTDIVDVTDPTSPVLAHELIGSWRHVHVRNNLAHLVRDGGIDIYNCAALPPTRLGGLNSTLLAGGKAIDLV